MYLYSTSVRSGVANPAHVMDWAIRITEKINQIGEVPSRLWTAAMSPAMGTLAWTAVVSDLTIIEETEAKLSTDPGYLALVEEAVPLLSSDAADQRLMQLIHADADAARGDFQYASTVRAALAPGFMRRGIELGVEIAQTAKQITGRPTSFAVSVTGSYGDVMWVSLAENIQQLQAANEALNANEEFSKQLDKDASKAYLPGATQTISRKIT
jgi:hypothetical protein